LLEPTADVEELLERLHLPRGHAVQLEVLAPAGALVDARDAEFAAALPALAALVARVDGDLKAVAPAGLLRVRRLGVAADDALGGNRGLGVHVGVKIIRTPLSIFCAENHN
jgi:hypothetical protein